MSPKLVRGPDGAWIPIDDRRPLAYVRAWSPRAEQRRQRARTYLWLAAVAIPLSIAALVIRALAH